MNKKYDIHDRIYKFIVRVIVLVNKLISATNLPKIKDEALDVLSEGKEIVAIVSTIINKTRR